MGIHNICSGIEVLIKACMLPSDVEVHALYDYHEVSDKTQRRSRTFIKSLFRSGSKRAFAKQLSSHRMKKG